MSSKKIFSDDDDDDGDDTTYQVKGRHELNVERAAEYILGISFYKISIIDIWFGLYIWLGCWLLYTGKSHLDTPCSNKLGFYFLIYGCLLIFVLATAMWLYTKTYNLCFKYIRSDDREIDQLETLDQLKQMFLMLLTKLLINLFLIVWFVVGLFWLFSVPVELDPCDGLRYRGRRYMIALFVGGVGSVYNFFVYSRYIMRVLWYAKSFEREPHTYLNITPTRL